MPDRGRRATPRKRPATRSVLAKQPLTVDDLAAALTPIAAKGLPAKGEWTDDRLLRLPNVLAYSANPETAAGRLRGLNDVLTELLANGEHEYAEAARRLFALDPTSRGTTLTHRGGKAATALGVSTGHFRQRMRGKVIKAVADDLFAHALRYQSATRAPSAQKITGDRPVFTLESISDEEESIARIWQHLYGWRAETIAAARLGWARTKREDFDSHAVDALREYALLHEAKTQWIDRFGQDRITAGEYSYDAEGIIRLAAWSHLDEVDTELVRLAAVRTRTDGSAAFARYLCRSRRGRQVLDDWKAELRALTAQTRPRRGSTSASS